MLPNHDYIHIYDPVDFNLAHDFLIKDDMCLVSAFDRNLVCFYIYKRSPVNDIVKGVTGVNQGIVFTFKKHSNYWALDHLQGGVEYTHHGRPIVSRQPIKFGTCVHYDFNQIFPLDFLDRFSNGGVLIDENINDQLLKCLYFYNLREQKYRVALSLNDFGLNEKIVSIKDIDFSDTDQDCFFFRDNLQEEDIARINSYILTNNEPNCVTNHTIQRNFWTFFMNSYGGVPLKSKTVDIIDKMLNESICTLPKEFFPNKNKTTQRSAEFLRQSFLFGLGNCDYYNYHFLTLKGSIGSFKSTIEHIRYKDDFLYYFNTEIANKSPHFYLALKESIQNL